MFLIFMILEMVWKQNKINIIAFILFYGKEITCLS